MADNDARRRAITELGTTFLVEAGAGTGKTTVLLQRLLTLVRSGQGQLTRTVAITFTEKAATELRVRLHRELDTALTGPLQDDERGHLYNARLQLAAAPISTIHSFCATLLRERPVEARVDPSFTILDEASAHLLRSETWQEWLAQEMDRGPQVLTQALRAGLTLDHLQTLGDFLVDYRDCLHLVPQPLPSPLPASRVAMQAELARLTALRTACRNATDQAVSAIEAIAAWLPADAAEQAWERLLLDDFPVSPRVGNRSNWQAAALDEVRATLRRLATHHAHARSTLLHNLVVALARWLTGFVHAYETKKHERGGLDFTDLLLYTRNLLAHSLEVRRYFQRKFDYLLVDEFQDTDPLQAEIMFFLAEQEARAPQWTAVRLRPGKLFVVGDPQQSIYRFRRADLAVYRQARQLIAQQGEVLYLSTNFRSRAPILHWLNETFARLFAEAPAEQPAYRALTPVRTEDTGSEVLLVPVPPELVAPQAGREALRHAEARTVAALLKQAVSSLGSTIWKDRPIRYGDVAILFRTYQAMDSYETALQQAGIPYRVIGGRRYGSRPEVVELYTLLRTIACPSDVVALVATLRSSVFGFSDEELAQFVMAGGKWSYLSPQVPPQLPNADHFTAAFALLRDLHRRHTRCSPASLLSDIYARTHLLPFFALRPHGTQRVTNLLKLIEVAHAFAAQGIWTLDAFTRVLQQQHELLEEEPGLSDLQEDAVRLLTIHKAKGLEFPVVILADATAPLHTRSPRTGILDRLGNWLELAVGPRFLTCTTQGWQKAEAQEQQKEAAEERRLHYVAAARVRDHLVIPIMPPKQGDTGYTHWALGEGAELLSGPSSPAGLQQAKPFLYQLSAQAIVELEQSSPPPWRSVPLAPHAADQHTRQTWEAERQAVLARGRRQDGQFLPLPAGDGELGEKRTTSLSPRVTSTAVRLVSPVFARARLSHTCLTDVPLTLRHKQYLYEGRVAIAFLEHAAWVLVHVMAGDISAASWEQYRQHPPPQVLLSARAFERLTVHPVKEVVLLCPSSQREVCVAWDEDKRRQAEGLLDALASTDGERT
ncbi:MAG: UvrD-helicase domain-containing protein [Candidatus Binatia bacterium]|nr:UvrD-helicase domain-containing protein [Candidatus Binatia bacterium]